jgi:hypothetical protein
MEKLCVLFILVLNLVSCSGDNTANSNTPISNYYGKWKLVKMEGSIPNSVTTEAAMEWQELYVFNTNGTFTKTRIRDNNTVSASGTFVLKTISNDTYFELTYPASNDIIGSCYGNLKEELFINKDGLLESTWRNCDGPGLVYQKTE